MKPISFSSSLTRWAVWLLGALVLAMGLSACGGQADPIPTPAPLAATPVPNTNPAAVPAAVDDSLAAPASAQITTGFNISGWV